MFRAFEPTMKTDTRTRRALDNCIVEKTGTFVFRYRLVEFLFDLFW